LLYHIDDTQSGYVSCAHFRLACEVLVAKFPEEAAACQHPEAVQRALGAAGEPTIDAPAVSATATAAAEDGGGWLNINEIVMRFLVTDAALDAQPAVAANANAASDTPTPPAADGDGANDAAGPFSRIAQPSASAKEDSADDAWYFDLVGHSRMAAFHHLLAHGRLAEVARSIGARATVPTTAAQSSTGSVGVNAAHTGVSTTATTREPAPVATSAAPARNPQRRIRNETRRGSLPYSVIAAHLDEEISLPPRARGHEEHEHDGETCASPIGRLRHTPSEEEFSPEALASLDQRAAATAAVNYGLFNAD